jgi:3-oxoacyl-[acyl-carrier protein] reductase
MVAGASRGLGFAVAKVLAAEGASVSIAARNTSALELATKQLREETSGRVHAISADVRSNAEIERWHKSTVEHFGPVDLLVTNSGGPPAGTFASFNDQAWQEAFELLLLSVVRMTRTVVPSMESRKKGSIVLLTSSSVKEPIANLTLSNVLRSSVSALSKTLANEYAGRGIRVNHLIPGRFDTDRVRELDQIAAKRKGISVEEQRNVSLANIPLGQYGKPEEFARAAAFLLSDAASYITGATLQIDGGQIRCVL